MGKEVITAFNRLEQALIDEEEEGGENYSLLQGLKHLRRQYDNVTTARGGNDDRNDKASTKDIVGQSGK